MVSVQHDSIVCSVCVQHVLWRDPCFHTPTTQPSSHIEPCQTITIGVLGALRPCGISHRLDLRHAPRCFPLGSNEGAFFGTFRGEMRMNIRPRFHFCTFPIKPNTWHSWHNICTYQFDGMIQFFGRVNLFAMRLCLESALWSVVSSVQAFVTKAFNFFPTTSYRKKLKWNTNEYDHLI